MGGKPVAKARVGEPKGQESRNREDEKQRPHDLRGTTEGDTFACKNRAKGQAREQRKE